MSHYLLTSSIFQVVTVKLWAKFIAWFYFCRWLKPTYVFFAKWEKTSFVQWSNIYIWNTYLTSKEIKAELDNVHSTSAPTFATVYKWMNLNVVVHPHVMHLVWDVQLRLLRQKSPIKSTILFWLIDEWKCESLLNTCCNRHITWHSDFNFTWTIGYEKAIGKMLAAFAHCGP